MKRFLICSWVLSGISLASGSSWILTKTFTNADINNLESWSCKISPDGLIDFNEEVKGKYRHSTGPKWSFKADIISLINRAMNSNVPLKGGGSKPTETWQATLVENGKTKTILLKEEGIGITENISPAGQSLIRLINENCNRSHSRTSTETNPRP